MTEGTGPEPGYLSEADARLADLIDLVSTKTDLDSYPHARQVEQNVLVYDSARVRQELSRPAARRRVEAELVRALHDGPGIVVFTGAFDDPAVGRATREFEAIIAAARMVEAPAFKEAFTGSTVRLGVIVSPFVYDTAIRHDQDQDYVGSYSPVPVEVKESRTTAWMMLIG